MGAGKVVHKADNSFGGQKQDLWIRYYLDSDNALTFMDKVESVFAAGYDYERDDAGIRRARIVGCKLFKKFIPEIEKWLDEEGLSEARLKAKLSELLEARETKFFAHQGVVVDTRDVVDHGVQLKALDMAFKVKGSYAPQKVAVDGNLSVPSDIRGKLDEILAGIKERAVKAPGD